MPGLVVTAATVITCSHGGQVKWPPTQQRALVYGAPIATAADQLTVFGCPGTGTPAVCTAVKWANVSGRVTASGQPVLLQALPPAGPVPGGGAVLGPPPNIPLVMASQLQVTAT